MAYLGWASLCLPARDVEASKRFYLASGLELVSEVPGERAILSSGGFRLALFRDLEGPVVNIRGGDIAGAHEAVRAVLPDIEGTVEDYTREELDADADGTCWATRDPAGNEVLFDTNDVERAPAYARGRTLEIIEAAAAELEALKANPRAVSMLREEVHALLEHSD